MPIVKRIRRDIVLVENARVRSNTHVTKGKKYYKKVVCIPLGIEDGKYDLILIPR